MFCLNIFLHLLSHYMYTEHMFLSICNRRITSAVYDDNFVLMFLMLYLISFVLWDV